MRIGHTMQFNFGGRKARRDPRSMIERYNDPVANLLYNVLIQAVRDHDTDYLIHGDGLIIWHWLKSQKERG